MAIAWARSLRSLRRLSQTQEGCPRVVRIELPAVDETLESTFEVVNRITPATSDKRLMPSTREASSLCSVHGLVSSSRNDSA